MYTGLKHLHLLLITLFVLSVLIKAILLLVNQEKFDSYRKKTKVPEMVITMLFLVSGIVMWTMRGSGLSMFFHYKLGAILVAIPLAIVGFKKKNKILGLLSAFLFIITIGLAFKSGGMMKEVHVEIPSTDANYGQALYEANCATCHGDAGAKQLGKAADLSNAKSDKTAFDIGNVITVGFGKMAAFKTLDSTEVKAIAEYVLTLKK